MPTLRDHVSSRVFRALLIGDSGTGKTGSLVEVINHLDELGIKRVIIADFDEGMDILSSKVKPEYMDRVFYLSFRDKLELKMEQGGVIDESSQLGSSWVKLVAAMKNWPDGVGNISNLTSDDMFVADSLTGLGDLAMNYSMVFGDKKGSRWKATGGAMGFQDTFVQKMTASNCHYLMSAHIRYMGGGGEQVVKDKEGSNYTKEVNSRVDGQALPSALGQALPGLIAKNFNTMLEYKFRGNKRIIRTKPDLDGRMAVKLPIDFEDEVDQEVGLYKIMKAFLGK